MDNDLGQKISSIEAHARHILEKTGKGPPDGMNPRIDHLEGRVDRIEQKLDTIIERLGTIATRGDMRTYLLTAIGIFVAIVAMLVTALGWLETREARISAPPAPPPQVLLVPAPPATGLPKAP
jgi:hypothetical protein